MRPWAAKRTRRYGKGIKDRFSATVELTAATVAFSVVGLFAKLIHGDALAILFGRAVFATLGLGVVVLLGHHSLRVKRADIPALVGAGIFAAGNWAGFFAAIKVSTLSVAVVSLFTYPLMTAIFEPWVERKRHDWFEVWAGVIVLGGVALVVPEFNLANRTTLGAVFGLLGALSFCLRNLVGRRLVPVYGGVPTMFWQLAIAIPIFAPFTSGWVGRWSPLDWGLLVLVGGVLTAFSQTLFFANLRRVTSSYASLMTSAQPVITVLLAVVFLGERPEPRTLAGGAILTLAVIAVALRAKRMAIPSPE